MDTKQSNQGISTDGLGRRKWDKAFFLQKEQEIANGSIETTPIQRTNLKKRSDNDVIDLDANVGEHRIVSERAKKAYQGGYYCALCDSLLKDSITYLDHINGRDHCRKLGMNMRVERFSVEQVEERLLQLKERDRLRREAMRRGETEVDVRGHLMKLEEDEFALKAKRKLKKKLKKEQKRLREESSGVGIREVSTQEIEEAKRIYSIEDGATPMSLATIEHNEDV